MKKTLLKVLLFLATSALGLLAAILLVNGFSVTVLGFVVVVIAFSVAQSILSPVIEKLVASHANALTGGVGVISTFVALFIANLISGGLTISGASAWISATLIIWLVTALGTWLLPKVFDRYFGPVD